LVEKKNQITHNNILSETFLKKKVEKIGNVPIHLIGPKQSKLQVALRHSDWTLFLTEAKGTGVVEYDQMVEAIMSRCE